MTGKRHLRNCKQRFCRTCSFCKELDTAFRLRLSGCYGPWVTEVFSTVGLGRQIVRLVN